MKEKDECHAWLRERSAQCGWRLELSEAVNQKELSQLARHLLGARQEPGLFHDQKIVKIVPSQPVSAEELARCDAQFYAQTGWHLTVDQGVGAVPEEASRLAGVTAPPGAWEVNRAMAHIREVAQITGLTVNKMSAGDGTLLLHGMTPESATPSAGSWIGSPARRGGPLRCPLPCTSSNSRCWRSPCWEWTPSGWIPASSWPGRKWRSARPILWTPGRANGSTK